MDHDAFRIHFAPMQGQTDAVYRQAHARLAGGVDCYYTPFIRLEKGQARARDLRDLAPGAPVVPQVIARDADELNRLTDLLRERGFSRVDLNMGCPHPPQMHHGRGAGLLPYPDKVAALMEVVRNRPDAAFSVKMRLGWQSPDECLALLPVLNDAPLVHVTLHARTARQQYRGDPQYAAFGAFLDGCRHPVIYNGGITGVQDLHRLKQRFPSVRTVMIGQGLLARPCLAAEYRDGTEWSEEQIFHLVMQLHEAVFIQACRTLQGDSQILSRMQLFWQPLEHTVPRKWWKHVVKAGTLKNYETFLRS